ncbi:hypothetical protein D3C87_1874540 [compost metagenome]
MAAMNNDASAPSQIIARNGQTGSLRSKVASLLAKALARRVNIFQVSRMENSSRTAWPTTSMTRRTAGPAASATISTVMWRPEKPSAANPHITVMPRSRRARSKESGMG